MSTRSEVSELRAAIAAGFAETGHRFDAVNQRLDALNSRVDTLLGALADLRRDFAEHTHD